MSWGHSKICDEPGCREYAKFSLSVALRLRPVVATEISKPLNFFCDAHKNQTMDEYISQSTWDKLAYSKKVQQLPMPIRCVSYLVIAPWKETFTQDRVRALRSLGISSTKAHLKH